MPLSMEALGPPGPWDRWCCGMVRREVHVSVLRHLSALSTLIEMSIIQWLMSVISRTPDVVVGGLKFYHDSIFYLSVFFRQLSSELSGRNPTKTCHIFGSELHLKVHIQNMGCPLPLIIGAWKLPIFDVYRRLDNVMSTSQVSGIDKLHSVENYEGSPTVAQNFVNFGPQIYSQTP